MMQTNVIYNKDCLEGMKELPESSIDLIVTDPPYGYSFMGKDWDKVIMGVKYWKECLRVLKHGSFCFVMSAPRQDVLSKAIDNLSRAGFNTGFTSIYWTYASGFPKAGNIGKMVDKRGGRTSKEYVALGKYLKEKIIDNNTKCAKLCGFSPSLVAFWKSGERVPNKKTYEKLKVMYGLDSRFDELVKRTEAEREVVGKGTSTLVDSNNVNAVQSSRVNFKPKEYDITVPATPQAQRLDGSYAGFQPKPAVEIIIVAMKPLSEKTYVDQALKNQKGITWLDDCRIPYDGLPPSGSGIHNGDDIYESGLKSTKPNTTSEQGRFPANLLVSDDILNIGIDQLNTNQPLDSGSYSRYFSLDKWAQKTFPFLIVPKASKSEKNKELNFNPIDNSDKYNGKFPDSKADKEFKNFHPTVKPVKLMSYLITLGSRKGDIVLDPFIGSGTTAVACRLLSRKYIGFEINSEYHSIAKSRLSNLSKSLEDFL